MRTVAEKPKASQQSESVKSSMSARAHAGQSFTMSSIIHLQRTIGNQAVQRLLKASTEDIEPRSANNGSSGLAHNFSRMALCSKNIYFGAGKSADKDGFTAHEPTRVLQRAAVTRPKEATHLPGVQREVQVRPPGRGEASAFDRRQELIDRMNGLSAGDGVQAGWRSDSS